MTSEEQTNSNLGYLNGKWDTVYCSVHIQNEHKIIEFRLLSQSSSKLSVCSAMLSHCSFVSDSAFPCMDCRRPGSSVHGLVNGVNIFFFFLMYLLLYLAVRDLSCCTQDLDRSCGMWDLDLQPVGSSSLTRGETQAPCVGSTES